jgi:leader peptidase (prepilin peptidase) / N-methyltransferase
MGALSLNGSGMPAELGAFCTMDAGTTDRLLAVAVAPFVGSFLGVVIRRLPNGRPVVFGRSACENCGRHLQPLDLVPILSWVVFGGRCRYCGAHIGLFHPAIEGAALAVALITAVMAPNAQWCWAGTLLGWLLLALAWIDAEHAVLPDALTLPLVLLGLLATWQLQPWVLGDHAAAAAIGYLAFRAIALLYRRLRHREGLGEGDAKLLAAGGAWLGVAALPVTVLLAALCGVIAVMARLARDPTRDFLARVSFGPWLALAIWTVWLGVTR